MMSTSMIDNGKPALLFKTPQVHQPVRLGYKIFLLMKVMVAHFTGR